MFVATGAPEALRASRRASFTAEFVLPLLDEAARVGLTTDEIVTMIKDHS